MRITTNYPENLTVKNIVLDNNKLTFDLEIRDLRLNETIRLTKVGKEELEYSGPGIYKLRNVGDANYKLEYPLREKDILYFIEED